MSSKRDRAKTVKKLLNEDPDKITRKKPKRREVTWKDLQWTLNQKKRLLSAMVRHGCTDSDLIAKEFPDKTKTAVKRMMAMLIRLSKNAPGETGENSLAVGWRDTSLFSAKKPIISMALKYIAMFEKQPPPEDCAECDFSALYKFLSNATLGRSALNTSLMTYETLWRVFDETNEEVTIRDHRDIRNYVKQLMEDERKEKIKTRIQ